MPAESRCNPRQGLALGHFCSRTTATCCRNNSTRCLPVVRRKDPAQVAPAGDLPAAQTPLPQQAALLRSAAAMSAGGGQLQPLASNEPAKEPDGALHDAEPSLTLRLSKPCEDGKTPMANGLREPERVGSERVPARSPGGLSGGSKATPQSSSQLQLAQSELPMSTGASRPLHLQPLDGAVRGGSGRCASSLLLLHGPAHQLTGLCQTAVVKRTPHTGKQLICSAVVMVTSCSSDRTAALGTTPTAAGEVADPGVVNTHTTASTATTTSTNRGSLEPPLKCAAPGDTHSDKLRMWHQLCRHGGISKSPP